MQRRAALGPGSPASQSSLSLGLQRRNNARASSCAQVAEVAGMSGIVALFFSGICHSHYTYYSASPGSQVGWGAVGWVCSRRRRRRRAAARLLLLLLLLLHH